MVIVLTKIDFKTNFIQLARSLHGDSYDYSGIDGLLKRNDTIPIKHNHCGNVTYVHAGHHVSNNIKPGYGCNVCFTGKVTTESFVKKCKLRYGDKFDYSKTVYIHPKIEIEFSCVEMGHLLFARPHRHYLSGKCQKCSGIKRRTKQDNFIEKCISIHGTNYSYDKVDYVDSTTYCIFKCNKCNFEFEQQPHRMISKSPNNKGGCPNYCYKQDSLSTKTFIEKAKEIHGEKYCYDSVVYIKYDTILDIFCKKCNMFFKQQASRHLNGQNCGRCKYVSKSISGAENVWLDSIKIDAQYRQLKIPKTRYFADALIDKTIYEYLGDYWHGNPRVYAPDVFNERTKTTMGNLYARTVSRHNKLLSLGYTVKFVWESDYDNGLLFSDVL